MLAGIETPGVLIDETIVDRNIARAQAQFNALGIALRPHIKTHKLVRFARAQLGAGAVGITCQKTTEAEVFVAAGCDDVLITFNILGPDKTARLRRLAESATLSVVADNPTVVAGLSKAFEKHGKPLRVLVECDTGQGRCGVQTPGEAAELAGLIAASAGLQFGGLMTYPAPNSHDSVERFLSQARDACLASAGSCETITSGGTPSMKTVPRGSVITEYRPGTYIYNDRSLVMRGACTWDDCAMKIAATVVSRPTSTRAILDSGSKTLSSDLLGMTGHGLIVEYPDAVITGLSEEHGHVELKGDGPGPAVGERVHIVPNHACVVTNLFDRVHLHRDGTFIETVDVDARGRVF